jgi:Sensors of blue-light using FAD
MLVRLLYASRAQGLGDAEIAAILRQARAHNPPLGLTGVLCHADGCFVQLLEGGREPVNQLYKHIVADPRHKDVTLLAYEEVAERRFAGWAMGQVNLARLNPALVLKYSAQPRLEPYAMTGKALMSLFEELVAAGVIVCN